ncbi:hypothetical protein WMF38_34940 [Sorangium sp. So ce118]
MFTIGYVCHETSDGGKFCVPVFAAVKERLTPGPIPDPEPMYDWKFNGRVHPAIRVLATLGTIELLARDLSDDVRSRLGEVINHAQRHAIGQLPSGVTFTEERATSARG